MKKIFILTAFFTLFLTHSVFAQEFNCRTIVDYNSGTVYFSGNAQPGGMSVIIFDNDTYLSDFQNDPTETESHILYNNQIKVDKNGSFSFAANIGNSLEEGEYTAYISQYGYDAAKDNKFYYMKNEDYQKIIDGINQKAAAIANIDDDFRNYIKDNMKKIGFESDYESLLSNKDSVIELLFDFAKTSGFDRDNCMKNTKIYKTACVIEAVKENASLLSGDWIDEVYIQGETLKADYEKYTGSTERLNCFISKLDMSQADLSNFENKIIDALVLTVVKSPNGVENIKNLFEKYSAQLKDSNGTPANTQKAKTDDYSKLVGDYDTVAKCIDKFNQLVSSESGNSGGNSGGSSGGGNKTGSGGSSKVVIAGTTKNDKAEIPIKFNDLNSVPWAYEAISNLFVKNIINGKTETEFVPNDNISREEFIKLTVCLFGLENNSYPQNVFNDVDESAWYSKYVNIAYSSGLCSGMGNGQFGVGQSITREDMCVMLYNGLKSRYSIKKENKIFDDNEDIAEYATEAVSGMGAAGIVNGMGDNTFKPQNNATRAEACVMIYNCLNYMSSL